MLQPGFDSTGPGEAPTPHRFKQNEGSGKHQPAARPLPPGGLTVNNDSANNQSQRHEGANHAAFAVDVRSEKLCHGQALAQMERGHKPAGAKAFAIGWWSDRGRVLALAPPD